MNPHEIATVRANAHTRFALMILARCYLDYADAEFTRDDGECVAGNAAADRECGQSF